MSRYILGISCFYHDSAACLLKDGHIIAAAHEERFTRIKHDPAFPARAIEFCLQKAGISAAEVEMVGFYEKPFLKFDRILMTFLATWPRGALTFLRVMPIWLRERLWTRSFIRERLPGFTGKIAFIEHHLSHAASAFFCSPFEQAAILTIDGVGEWSTASWSVGNGRQIEPGEEIRFPHSLGLLYSTFTAYLGFKVNEGEYKVMGLAPYGTPAFLGEIESIAKLNEDGSLWLDMDYFEFQHGHASFGKRFIQLFGPPREKEAPFTQRDYDIAASIQKFCEEAMVKMAQYVWEKTKAENLCLAGGVALNCVGNSQIKNRTPFKRIFIQPAAGDAGGALGIARYLWHSILDQPRIYDFEVPFFGTDHSDQQIQIFLDDLGVPYQRLDETKLLTEVARLLADENVVGWMQSGAEFGPRALGHRSILADPRPHHMRDTVNLKIKFREGFRPFAPSVLAEKAGEWFEFDGESPHMLYTAQVAPEHMGKIPAVTHIDGSARIQTVRREHEPRFHGLIQEFEKLTGVPMVLNTSFNRKDEPIVDSPADAYACFLGSGLDALVIDTFLILKQNHNEH